MATSVKGAFDAFRKNVVDLNSDATATARKSRDYLFEQLKALNQNDTSCPNIWSCMSYGSFARRTKIQPLDDIDLLSLMLGTGLSIVNSTENPKSCWLKIENAQAPLAVFRDDHGYVSSIKLLNQLKKSLAKIPNYSKAETKRNQQAVVLNLSSYSWVYDIVPAIGIGSAYDKSVTDFYLIPNGIGDWMKTDPRKDLAYTTKVNSQHEVNILEVIRLLKYWNNRNHKPRLESYYFETICLKVFDNASTFKFIQTAIQYFFAVAPMYIKSRCLDPKGLGADLDVDVLDETKRKVMDAMTSAHTYAYTAVENQKADQTARAIACWQQLFGSSFPSYG